jgi:hypothetical protein
VATVRNALGRIGRAWGALAPDQRLAAGAALGVLVAMFLPWYSSSANDHTASAWAAVTFIEGALFLVSAGVLVLLFYRAEQRAFHLPGGDGSVIFAAGVWDTFLVLWRVFDQPDLGAGSTGLQWGIFFAFVATGVLTYAGWRMRTAHRAEPTAAQDPTTKVEPTPPPMTVVTPVGRNAVRRRRRVANPDDPTRIAGQLSFEEEERGERPLAPGEIPPAGPRSDRP